MKALSPEWLGNIIANGNAVEAYLDVVKCVSKMTDMETTTMWLWECGCCQNWMVESRLCSYHNCYT